MVYYKTKDEIELIRKSCLLVSATLAEVARFLKPGITTLQIDTLAEKFIRDHGAIPSFKNYHGFPFTSCISVNDAVVHGFPNNNVLKEGDVVSVDLGAFMNGYHGDSAYTFALGEVTDDIKQLLRVTKESLYKGVEKAVSGNRVGDISHAVQEHAEKKFNYGVVRELVGHGLGKDLHEEPQVPNYGRRGTGLKMKEGLVIAIEPMINMGRKEIYYDDDGWTVKTKDGLPAAHYEHTVCVQKSKPDILSSFAEIEAGEKANPDLNASYY
ncbi:MAG: type I methionyl aminopeptidase [Chitinophagaceae bacterium]|nr:type I methionyl aminopeptidase [Chitinophagaceae bacterium]